MPLRKDTAELMAKQLLRAHYRQGSFEVQEVRYADSAASPFAYIVTGRVDTRDDYIGRPHWTTFEILVNPKAEEILDYKIGKQPDDQERV